MQAISAFLAALAQAIKPYIPQLIQAIRLASAGFVGAKLEEGARVKEVVKDVKAGEETSRRVASLSHDERVRRLKERGIY